MSKTSQRIQLEGDDGFRRLVRQAIVKVAAEKKAELKGTQGDTAYDKIQTLAEQVLSNPDRHAPRWAIYVATEGSFSDILTPVVGEVLQTISNGWGVMAGLREGD